MMILPLTVHVCRHKSRERAIVRKAHAVCFPCCSHALSRPRLWLFTKNSGRQNFDSERGNLR